MFVDSHGFLRLQRTLADKINITVYMYEMAACILNTKGSESGNLIKSDDSKGSSN